MVWFLRAAEQGSKVAQYNLGLKYLTGEGLPQDYVQAAKLFGFAAMQRYAPAVTCLGALYMRGQGVEKDEAKATELFCKLLRAGSPMPNTSWQCISP